MPKDAASDNLSDEVERRMRDELQPLTPHEMAGCDAAISVAVEMLREERERHGSNLFNLAAATLGGSTPSTPEERAKLKAAVTAYLESK